MRELGMEASLLQGLLQVSIVAVQGVDGGERVVA
jgi:hypothetical protein